MIDAQRKSWRDVYERINIRILDGTYGPGARLPRDEDFAAEFECARSTIQRAMRELSDQGTIERRRKGGTRVLAYPVTRTTVDIPVTRKEIEATGRRYSHQLISCRRETCPRSVAAKLVLSEPVEMLRVRALHLADRQPFVFEDRWISIETVPEILGVDLTRISANEWLVQNRPYDTCEVQFFAKNADADEASFLETREGKALMVIDRTTWIGSDPITNVKAITAPGYRVISS